LDHSDRVLERLPCASGLHSPSSLLLHNVNEFEFHLCFVFMCIIDVLTTSSNAVRCFSSVLLSFVCVFPAESTEAWAT